MPLAVDTAVQATMHGAAGWALLAVWFLGGPLAIAVVALVRTPRGGGPGADAE